MKGRGEFKGPLMAQGVKGIVLAGVHHWRNSALERVVPRPLVPIGDRPLIGHVLSWLSDGGVEDATVCANSDTEVLRRNLSPGAAGALVLNFYEDHMPRGPAGCVRDASEKSTQETVVIVDATIIPQSVELHRLLTTHAESGAAMTVAVIAKDRNPVGEISELEPIGVYALARRALEHVAATGYQDIKETLIPRLYENGEKVMPFFVDQPCPRVAGADSCLAAGAWMLGRAAAANRTLTGYRRVGEAQVHNSAMLGANTRLIGPVMIGPESHIGDRAAIIGPTTLGSRCHVGEEAVISRSAIWDDARIGASAIVDRCIITYEADVDSHSEHYNTVYSSEAVVGAGLLSGWKRRNS